MKTFDADKFNKNPNQVYQEVALSGQAKIRHNNYQHIMFVITCVNKGAKLNDIADSVTPKSD